MTRREKALARLLNTRGDNDQGWKTYEEIDEALNAIGWHRHPGSSTHRAAWVHSECHDPDMILDASLQNGRIKPSYIKAMRKKIIAFSGSDDFDPRIFPEMAAYFNAE